MSTFDQLLNSGLQITWMTILMAWKSLANTPTALHSLITTEEVLAYAMDAYAMDRVGDCPPEQETLVARLAFSDAQDTWTIRQCLEELALNAHPEAQRAASLRVWRLVLLNEIVTELERQSHNLPDKSNPIYGAWMDDFSTSVFCDLDNFWAEFEFPSQEFAVPENSQYADWFRDTPSLTTVIAEHRRWLVQEAAALQHNRQNESYAL